MKLTLLKPKQKIMETCPTCCWSTCNVIKISKKKGRMSCNTWCQHICNIVYLPHQKCEIDHGICNMTQMATI